MAEQLNQVDALPSARTLIRSTLIAAVVATILLVTIVLPAEYAIDPTGIGRLLGLAEMGDVKVSLEQEARTDAKRAPTAVAPCPPAVPVTAAHAPPVSAGSAASPASSVVPTALTHVTRVTLKPGEGKEVKLKMRAGARATFAWVTDTGVVNYDTHGDDAQGTYHGYGKGTGERTQKGVLVAAVDGMHGWFWRNRTKQVVTITLETSGDYQELKELE